MAAHLANGLNDPITVFLFHLQLWNSVHERDVNSVEDFYSFLANFTRPVSPLPRHVPQAIRLFGGQHLAECHVVFNLVVASRLLLAAPTKPEAKNALWTVGVVFVRW
jgi:hypothetical protein